jgi:hypothetical protein
VVCSPYYCITVLARSYIKHGVRGFGASSLCCSFAKPCLSDATPRISSQRHLIITLAVISVRTAKNIIIQICKLCDFCQRIADIEPGNINEMIPDLDDVQIPCLTKYNEDFHNFKITSFIVHIPQSCANEQRTRNIFNRKLAEPKEKAASLYGSTRYYIRPNQCLSQVNKKVAFFQ